MMNSPFRPLEKTLGHRFKKRGLLELALTHPSHRHEQGEGVDNQRLEFLGDAVLGMLAAETLYARPGELPEGEMTQLRSALGNRHTLADIGRAWELGEWLRFGKGEKESGGSDRDSNLADAVEAVIGAIYLDGGWKAANKLFVLHILPLCPDPDAEPQSRVKENPKGALQEFTQARWQSSPDYDIVDEKGPAHERIYVAAVTWKGEEIGRGEARSKRSAEARAARVALDCLRGREEEEAS